MKHVKRMCPVSTNMKSAIMNLGSRSTPGPIQSPHATVSTGNIKSHRQALITNYWSFKRSPQHRAEDTEKLKKLNNNLRKFDNMARKKESIDENQRALINVPKNAPILIKKDILIQK